MHVLQRLLRPRSVAIVGASADPAKLAGRPLVYLEKYGFTGDVYPVNPRYDAIGGHRCYPDIASLPRAPDAAIVVVGAAKVIDTVRQLAAIGTHAAIVLASGFGESGPEGQAREDELKRAAGNMRLLGPNTIGLVNVNERIVLSASHALVTDEIAAGNIALVSQSGGILGSLLSRAQAAGIGFSKMIATGNECDFEISDFIDYLVDDDATKVIALYIEGLRKPEAFQTAVIRAHTAGKPLVVFKVGRSESGARSAVSHTGAMAGSDSVYDAMFRQFGIIRAERYSDLLDIPLMLSRDRALNGKRLAIITSTGGLASLLADAAGVLGFETPPPDETTSAKLEALAIEGATLDRNPIDVTLAGVKPDIFRTILGAVAESPRYDAIAVVLGSSALREPETVGGALRECAAASDKPIVGFVSPAAPQLVQTLNLAGIPTFGAPESCAAALAALRRASKAGLIDYTRGGFAELNTQDELKLSLRPGALNEADSKQIFARFGIPVTREIVAKTPADAEAAAKTFASNVVVKVLSSDVLHKSDAGGVAVDVAHENVASACAKISECFFAATRRQPEGFLVQELVSGGVELILGFHHDEQLGPVILLGMGGVAAELHQDTSLRLAPITRRDANEMIDDLTTSALLKGFRGAPIADIEALISAIVAFSDMLGAIGSELQEAEINPLFVLPRGRGVIAADGLVVVKGEQSDATISIAGGRTP